MFPLFKIWAAWPDMLSVYLIRCTNEALKTLYFKSIMKCFKRMNIDKWPDSPYSFPPIDCCVRRNGEPDHLFSGDIQPYRFLDSDCINFKTFAFLAVYWPFWTSLYKTHIKVQQCFLYRSFTMLNNVFKVNHPPPPPTKSKKIVKTKYRMNNELV